MIKKLLQLIQKNGISSRSILAKEMNISVELLDLMLTDLQRKGYIEVNKIPDGTSCEICPFHKICKISKEECESNNQQTLRLTKKGLDFVNSQ